MSPRGRKRGSNRSQQRRSPQQQRRQGGNRTPRQRGAGFWGEAAKLPPMRQDVQITPVPSAVPRSLGEPPLPGHEAVAEHYFAAVYDRAVSLAGALAAAGGLIEPEELVRDED